MSAECGLGARCDVNVFVLMGINISVKERKEREIPPVSSFFLVF